MSKVMNEFIEEKAKQLYTEVGIQYREILDKINIEDFIRRLLEEAQGMGEDWLPTPENINALPEPVREYIAGLETNADPPSMVADNIIMKDTIKALEIKCEEKPAVDEGFVNTWANEFATATIHDKEMHRKIVYMLKEAGVEVIKK